MCIKLLYPSIRVRTATPVSVRVRNRVSVSFSFTILCFEIVHHRKYSEWAILMASCRNLPALETIQLGSRLPALEY